MENTPNDHVPQRNFDWEKIRIIVKLGDHFSIDWDWKEMTI